MLITIPVMAQNSGESLGRFTLRALELSYTSHANDRPYLSSDDFRQLYGPDLPTINASQDNIFFFPLNFSGQRIYGLQNSINLGAWLDINRKDGAAAWGSPSLRLGLSYTTRQDYLLFGTESNRYKVDSITSTFQGQTNTVYIDSVHNKQLFQSFGSNRLSLNIDLLWRTNELGRFTFYGGFGIGAGMSLNSVLMYNLSEYSYRSNENSYFNNSNTISQGEKKGPAVFDFRMNMILGTELRLGKKGFLEKTSLFYEWRPTVVMNQTSGLGAQWIMGQSHTLGLRFRF